MIDQEILKGLAIAVAIGALIGIERETSQKEEEKIIMGVRTFTLTAIFGFLSAYLSSLISPSLLLVALGSVVSFSLFGYYVKSSYLRRIGLTTSIAFILTFLIGAIAFFDSYPYLLTTSFGLIIGFVLVIKEYTRKFAKSVLIKEVRAAIIFGILTFIILPILPNQPVDPLNLFNPYLIWLSVVLVLMFSFMAYIGMKIYGARGVSIAGGLGGLISSTGVSFTMARKVKRDSSLLEPASFAVTLASSTMFLRVLAISSALNQILAFKISVPMILIGTIGYAFSTFFFKKVFRRKERSLVQIGSPLAIKTAVEFSLLFAAVLAISQLAIRYFGSSIILLISFLSGLVSLDAITITLATLDLPTSLAAKGIVLACLSNTLFKWVLVSLLGSKEMGKKVSPVFLGLIGLSLFLFFLL